MKSRILIGLMSVFLISSCGSEEVDYYPKPRGFLRLDFPEREFETYSDACPFSFEIPKYFEVIDKEGSCNKDINIDRFRATLFLTYIPVDTNLIMNVEYSRKLVYDHSIKADEIKEATILHPDNNVFGTKYKIIGNAASPYQFYVTDSVNHFLRGALYFNAKPNYDSLKPSLEYVLEDVENMLQSIKWDLQTDSLITE